jgi:hypothetical protein
MEPVITVLILLNFISYDIGIRNGFNDGFPKGQRYQQIQTVVEYDRAFQDGYIQGIQDVHTMLTDAYLDGVIKRHDI